MHLKGGIRLLRDVYTRLVRRTVTRCETGYFNLMLNIALQSDPFFVARIFLSAKDRQATGRSYILCSFKPHGTILTGRASPMFWGNNGAQPCLIAFRKISCFSGFTRECETCTVFRSMFHCNTHAGFCPLVFYCRLSYPTSQYTQWIRRISTFKFDNEWKYL